MTGSVATFERYQAPALHEAGHAVIAVVLGRTLIQISIIEDENGGGYVTREQRENSPQEILEEIVIALAGGEAPNLWGNWPTNTTHDEERIGALLRMNVLPAGIDWPKVHTCLKDALGHLSEALTVLGQELSKRRIMAGSEAESLIVPCLPQNIGLRESLAICLNV